MTVLSQRELKRHELMALVMLLGGMVIWAIAAVVRARQAWIAEYTHAMIGVAVVMVFTSLVWRSLAYAQPFRQPTDKIERLRRMQAYLGCYALVIVMAAAWLIFEQRRLPETAWMRDQHASVVVLYALLAIALPWVALVAAHALDRGRR